MKYKIIKLLLLLIIIIIINNNIYSKNNCNLVKKMNRKRCLKLKYKNKCEVNYVGTASCLIYNDNNKCILRGNDGGCKPKGFCNFLTSKKCKNFKNCYWNINENKCLSKKKLIIYSVANTVSEIVNKNLEGSKLGNLKNTKNLCKNNNQYKNNNCLNVYPLLCYNNFNIIDITKKYFKFSSYENDNIPIYGPILNEVTKKQTLISNSFNNYFNINNNIKTILRDATLMDNAYVLYSGCLSNGKVSNDNCENFKQNTLSSVASSVSLKDNEYINIPSTLKTCDSFQPYLCLCLSKN